jgi:hypothetical protein
VKVLGALVYMSVQAWTDEEVARPYAEERLHRQIEAAGGIVTGKVVWEKEEIIFDDEVYVAVVGRLRGYKRDDTENGEK